MEIDVQSGLNAVLESKRRTYPQHVNRISSLDDPCLRRLYYRRAAWDKAVPHPTSLVGVFETGNILEPVIERIVSEVGHASNPRWRIVGSQTPTNDKFLQDYQIAGSIDGFLQVFQDDRWQTAGVVDIKTASGNIYPQINGYDDLGRYPWTRAYRGQLMTYAFAHDMEDCYILFVNKQNLYDMKFVHFKVDMDYMERLLQRATAVNRAITDDVAPEGINDPDVCPKCQWFAYCTPSFSTGGNLQVVDNEELEIVLTRMHELSPEVAEYRDLEKQRDLMLTKGRDMAVGPFLVTWKQTKSKAWRKSIVKL